MTGWPYLVLKFRESVAPKEMWKNVRKPMRASESRNNLVFAAIFKDDLEVLTTLYELHKLPQNRTNEHLAFSQSMLYAVVLDRVEVL